MPDIKFNCPNCDQTLEAPDDMAGVELECPACEETITVPAPEQPEKPASRLNVSDGSTPAMTEDTPSERKGGGDPCPECGAELEVGAVLCVECGFNFAIL